MTKQRCYIITWGGEVEDADYMIVWGKEEAEKEVALMVEQGCSSDEIEIFQAEKVCWWTKINVTFDATLVSREEL